MARPNIESIKGLVAVKHTVDQLSRL